MSWFARSIAATLSSAHSDDEDDSEATSGDKTPPRASDTAGADAVDLDEQPDTPSRGVKGDISELTETLTRRFWGVASFLAPPPTEAKEEEEEEAVPAEAEDEEGVQSPRIAGIRSDLAEIGGRVRTGISILSNANAVADFSKIASSFLPFGPGAEEVEGEAVGVTDEVVVFVKNISKHPETWLDFPLFVNDRLADDFELSDPQYRHALSIEHLVPSLSYLRTELCSTEMSEACFWKIYFVLLHSVLNEQDAAALLSSPQILEAKEELLQHSPTKNKISPKGTEDNEQSSENRNVPSTQPEDKELSPLSIQNKSGISETPLTLEPTSDPMADDGADKHPISTTETEIIDKPVIQEELVVKTEMKSIPDVKSNLFTAEDDDKEVDDWLQDMSSVPSKTGKATAAGVEEDISFSDLEDD